MQCARAPKLCGWSGLLLVICPSVWQFFAVRFGGIIRLIGGTCMRISGLLLVLLVGFVSVCAAGDAVRQSSSSQNGGKLLQLRFDQSLRRSRSRISSGACGSADRVSALRLRAGRRCDLLHDACLPGETHEPAFRCNRAGGGGDLPVRASKYSVRKVEESGKAPSR